MTAAPPSGDHPPDTDLSTKTKKAKKRPSDFEIVRTIFTRTTERKLPFWLKDMGEDSDIFFLCSQEESGFTYGSPDISIALLEITDPALRTVTDLVLAKLHGTTVPNPEQRVINLRDQISELAKTKGEAMPEVPQSNGYGSVWVDRQDKRGQTRTLYYVKAIDCLFHMQLVSTWCAQYRPLLTSDSHEHLFFEYRHTNPDTAGIVTLPPPVAHSNHRLEQLYPHGFRAMVTRGHDVLIDKFVVDFPYPVISQTLIVFHDNSASCQWAHRIIADGWRMVLLRPNAVFFPMPSCLPLATGSHTL